MYSIPILSAQDEKYENYSLSILTKIDNRDYILANDEAKQVVDELKQFKMPEKVMVDCSHGNSNKDFRRQSEVLRDVASQIKGGSKNLMGVMIESHLVEGNQKLNSDLSKLTYGQSVTDACINFSTTEILLEELAESVK